MSLLALSGTNSVSGGYEIGNSLKLEDDNEEGMAKNFTGDGDRRTWTYSTWVKRTEITGSDSFHLFGASYSNIQFMTNDLLRVELYDGSNTRYADLNRVFRDTSAWYHIVVALDSTQSTAADRVKIYINGVQDTSFNNSTYTNMSQNDQFDFGSASANYQFGYYFAGGSNDRRFCGYVAETHYVNGTALDETSFGEFDNNGIWIPKEYTGSHGSKGFYFKFDEAGNIHSRLFSKDMNFPKNPGANPDWSVHQIFKNPGSTLVQVSELEGGKKFINISKTIKRSLVNINETSPLFSIILGCEIRYMENLVYADTLLQNKVQKVSKIHIGCRLCGMNVCEHKKNETDLATLLDPNIRYYGLFEFNG